MIMRLELPGLTPCNSARHRHWSLEYRERKRWKAAVRWEVLACLGDRSAPCLARARVKITRRSTAAKSPDRDNLTHGAKWILDGLVEARVLLDDSPDVLVGLECDWERVGRRRDQQMIVVVEEIPRADSPILAGLAPAD